MSTWLGTLSRGGIIRDPHEEAGVAVAAYVVGEDRLSQLREWMASEPEEVRTREQRGAIQVCFWTAHADREVAEEERDLLRQIVLASELPEGERSTLLEQSEEPSLRGIEKRVTHPVLRELLLALSWELAAADGRIHDMERAFHQGLAKRLEIPEGRAAEIRESIGEQVGGPEL